MKNNDEKKVENSKKNNKPKVINNFSNYRKKKQNKLPQNKQKIQNSQMPIHHQIDVIFYKLNELVGDEDPQFCVEEK